MLRLRVFLPRQTHGKNEFKFIHGVCRERCETFFKLTTESL